MKKKTKRLLKTLGLTTLFGGLQVGILLLSEFLAKKLSMGNNDVLFVSMAIIVFFVISFFYELIEDKIER